MPRPSFFLVGAPKCGTTSLCHYLSQHPGIFIPGRKELNFFATDLALHRYYHSEREYVSAFDEGLGNRICGEGTSWYLYSETAAREIKTFNSDAKIIISLRNPVDMAYSLHRFFVYIGWESVLNFSEALKQQESDMSCACDRDAYKKRVTGRIYTLAPMYYEQVRRYLDVFDPANVKIVLFDDLRDSRTNVYRELCEFLGLEPDPCAVLGVENPGRQWRSNRLQAWQRHPPGWIKRAWHLLPLSKRSVISSQVRQLNTRVSVPSLDPDLRRRLSDIFRLDVARLSELLGRDLTHWVTE